MLTVDQLIDQVIQREGGFSDHPADRGGPTKYGITQRTLSQWIGKPASKEQIKNLTRRKAEEIYTDLFFTRPGIFKLPDPLLPIVFDSAVNHGPARAVRMLQEVINDLGFSSIDEDGLIGPDTIDATRQALAKIDENWLIAAYVEQRRLFYKEIVERDPSQQVFLRGWMNRIREFWPSNFTIEFEEYTRV